MTMTRIVRRTLRERLFSLPWRPLQSTKEIPDPTMEHIRKGWAAMPIDRVLDPGRPGRVAAQRRIDVTTLNDDRRRHIEVADDGGSLLTGMLLGAAVGHLMESRGISDNSADTPEPIASGGGGDFGGGGASGSWESSSPASDCGSSSSDASSSCGSAD